jgi:cardiolipin synthase A/B
MEKLLDAVAALVCLVSPEKVQAIAGRIRKTDASKAETSLTSIVGTPAASGVIDQLVEAWKATNVDAEELSSMLLAASNVFTKVASHQTMELVWTGPTTPFVSTRRTEQALLQVINSAKHTLFITSFVAYDVSTIVKSLNAAAERGVSVSILLELSQAHGGNVTFDGIEKMRVLVPKARFFAWHDKDEPFNEGSVHAKVAVGDSDICFITSANLTGYAMERNMEAGVLISGGDVPRTMSLHLQSLVDTCVVSPV